MPTLIPGSEPEPSTTIDYHAEEGLKDADPVENPIVAASEEDGGRWREWMMVGIGLTALVAILAILVSAFALATGDDSEGTSATPAPAAQPAAAGETAAPTLADAKGIAFEPFERVDPTLPPVPAGAVKTFKVDVYQHVTQVSKDLAPTEVWSFAVNGKRYSGTGVSGPMVVNEGDTVDFTLTNGSDASMKVDLPHSLDFHSAEVNPGTRYKDLAPGDSMHYRFVAEHPGVFMYHCATQPVLMHTGAGMVGMFVVKPKDLAPVDKELWITQQEYYIGKPGGDADMAKMAAKKPDVIAFNGYANQYKQAPIGVRKGEKVRIYVLNAGPSVWSAFHVIGTVFDRTWSRAPRPRRADDQPRAVPGRLGRVHARRGGDLPVRQPRLRRHGQGLARHPRHPERPHGGRARLGARRAPRRGRSRRRDRRDDGRHVDQVGRPDGQGRQGHLRRQERGRDDARPGDRQGPGRGDRRHARREHVPRQGRQPGRRRERDRERRPRARRLRAGLLTWPATTRPARSSRSRSSSQRAR